VRAAVRKEWPFGNALELQASAPIQVETDIERV
jgi:hypothetical protein